MRELAVALLVVVLSWLALRRRSPSIRFGARMRTAGLALGSFLMAAAHGAGLMLVPALVPLCAGAGGDPLVAAGASALTAAAAAVAVHTAAMLLVARLLASAFCRAFAAIVYRRRVDTAADRRSATSLAKALSTAAGSLSAPAAAADDPSSKAASMSSESARERPAFIAARVAIRRFDSAITASRVSGVM